MVNFKMMLTSGLYNISILHQYGDIRLGITFDSGYLYMSYVLCFPGFTLQECNFLNFQTVLAVLLVIISPLPIINSPKSLTR